MTISFGETFDKVRECFNEPSILSELAPKLDSVTIIRDVNGKIRLFLDLSEGQTPETIDTNELNRLLCDKLGPYYGNDIWLPAGERDPYKPLIETIEAERVIAYWDDESVPRWYVLERHIAKQAWTDKNLWEPPWEEKFVVQGHKPAIASFFSFKGGVGRTSAVVATALTLARNGHRVAIVDLDLEAPGLATVFSEDNFSKPGVIDYLLEKKIQGKDWKLRTQLISIKEKTLLGDNGQPIQLFPAGTLDLNYLEKLARLDFQNLVGGELGSRMQDMLKELESAAKTGKKPLDFILMDARAGFHDLGGLAIANLSHAAVICGTRSRQSWAGLTPVIRHLATLGADEGLPLILVHSMAPALGTPRREQTLREFREQAYVIFQDNYYSERETIPNLNDLDAPFTPVAIPYQERLSGDLALFPPNSTPEESNQVSDLVNILTNSPYQDIAEKLCLIFGREFQKVDPNKPN